MSLASEIQECIDKLGSKTHERFDCPSCGGEYCLSISRVGTKVKYHCFRNICKLAGGKSAGMSPSDIRKALEGHQEIKKPFELPDYWTKGLSSEKCLRLLLKTHSLDSYKRGLFSIAYDPKEDRMCYLIRDDKAKIVGAVGRTLCNAQPKARIYSGSSAVPFIVRNGNTVVCTEDCASAASVTRLPVSGLGLLGTNLKEEYIPYITKFPEIIIALDADAIKTAIKIKNRLTYYHNNVKLWLLKTDIKDQTNEMLIDSYSAAHSSDSLSNIHA